MARVICRNAVYDYALLKPLIFEMLDSLEGGRIGPGSRVVIKPNFLAPASPETAMLTHPLVLKAVSEYVNSKGVRPLISDSPAMGTFEKVLTVGCFRRELAGLDVEFKEFRDSVRIDIGKPFNEIEIAEDVINADIVINLPKLKTHQQMLLTLGVKNLFGCIVGFRKPEWHFRTGIDREMFAGLLVSIHSAVSPAITIVDGILGMEGQGPGRSGTPREFGVVLGSTSSIALDITISKMAGIDPEEVLTNKIAVKRGFKEEIEIDGQLPFIRDFKFPRAEPVVFGPRPFHGFLRKHMVQRPEVNDTLCKLCGECWRICPAKAISHTEKKPAFNYNECIRCYCCVEVCPHGALRARETAPGKLIRMFIEHGLKKIGNL